MTMKYILDIKCALLVVIDSFIAKFITFLFMYYHYYIHVVKKFFIIFSFIFEQLFYMVLLVKHSILVFNCT